MFTRQWLFALATFLSAFLLFMVQPMVSKALLPSFGGSYLVWGACMVFFQSVLAVGYLYAHFAQRLAGVARYSRAHVLLVIVAMMQAPFDMEALGSAEAGAMPAVSVFRLLLGVVGLPAFILSTTSLVMQRWFAESDQPGRENPYVLYAASNLGSMLGLLAYPLAIEPLLDLRMQGVVWWGGYVVLALAHIVCRPRKWVAPTTGSAEDAPRAGARAHTSWFLLGMAGCTALLAVTNVITLDVASAPFLWVLPLAVYLLAFVLAFKRNPWFPAWVRGALGWAVLVGVMLHLMAQLRLALPVPLALLLHLAILFVVCINAAGELVAVRPAANAQLTAYYVVMSLGGLAGSAAVSWVLPVASDWLVEYPLALALAVVAAGVARGHRSSAMDASVSHRIAMAGVVALCVAGVAVALVLAPWLMATAGGVAAQPAVMLVVCGCPLAIAILAAASRPALLCVLLLAVTVCMTWTEQVAVGAQRVARLRNFYGIYKVYERGGQRILQHGTTQHGRQYLDRARAGMPLAYFHPSTPAAGVLSSECIPLRRIGMVGLGTGALVTYGRPGSEFVVFELDPDNIPIAEGQFSYLHAARSNGVTTCFVTGDARLSLRKFRGAGFDVFIVDAFSSGAIPVHLMTREAFSEYMGAMANQGVLLLHISNRSIDLHPVVYSIAESLNLHAFEKTNAGAADPDANDTFWMAVTRDDGAAKLLVDSLGWRCRERPVAGWPRPWTDRYANIFGAMVWR
jgi:hypothetical protein